VEIYRAVSETGAWTKLTKAVGNASPLNAFSYYDYVYPGDSQNVAVTVRTYYGFLNKASNILKIRFNYLANVSMLLSAVQMEHRADELLAPVDNTQNNDASNAVAFHVSAYQKANPGAAPIQWDIPIPTVPDSLSSAPVGAAWKTFVANGCKVVDKNAPTGLVTTVEIVEGLASWQIFIPSILCRCGGCFAEPLSRQTYLRPGQPCHGV